MITRSYLIALVAVSALFSACSESAGDAPVLAAVQVQGKWGWIDTTGQWAIPAEHAFPSQFNEGLAVMAVAAAPDSADLADVPAARYGYLHPRGDMAIAAQYALALPYSEGLAMVRTQDKLQYLDANGQLALSIPYGFATPFIQGRAMLGQTAPGKKGYSDTQGKLVIHMVYDGAYEYSEGRAIVYMLDTARQDSSGRRARRWGAIDETGKMIIPLKYKKLGTQFRSGLTHFNDGQRFGYLDRQGRVVIPAQFPLALNFRGDRAPVLTYTPNGTDGLKWALINPKGEEVVPAVFDLIDTRGYLHSGLILVGRMQGEQRRMGFIDKNGKIIIPLNYPTLDVFYEGRALAQAENGKWGWIDTRGQWIIPPTYEKATHFVHTSQNYLADPDYSRDQ
ncbi:MAG: WG repeat-containing protein [Sphingobacteriia bacterium]